MKEYGCHSCSAACPCCLPSDSELLTCFLSLSPCCRPSHCCFHSHHFPLSLPSAPPSAPLSHLSSDLPAFSPFTPPSLLARDAAGGWLLAAGWLAVGGYSFIIPLVFQTASPQCHRSLIFAIIICLFYLTWRQHNDLSAAALSPLRVSSISKLTTVIREPRFR